MNGKVRELKSSTSIWAESRESHRVFSHQRAGKVRRIMEVTTQLLCLFLLNDYNYQYLGEFHICPQIHPSYVCVCAHHTAKQ